MKLNERGRQTLSDIINAGVEKSAEKLAAMSNSKWDMQTISVKIGPMDQLRFLFQDDDTEYYGAAFSMPGGAALLLASTASTRVMAKAYLGERMAEARRKVAELEIHAIGEIANVLANTLAGELADACGVDFLMAGPVILRGNKPQLSVEMRKQFPWAEKDLAMSSYVHVASSSLSVGCSTLMLLNEALAGRLIQALNAA